MVKKNYVLLMLGLVFVTVGLFAYVFEDKESTENSLLLANVEALTQSESEGTGKIYIVVKQPVLQIVILSQMENGVA